MKINAATSIYAVEQYRNLTNKGVPSAKVGQQKDHIEISDEAVSFNEVFKAAKKTLDGSEGAMKPEALSAIRQEIGSGTYQVNDEELADSILFSVWG